LKENQPNNRLRYWTENCWLKNYYLRRKLMALLEINRETCTGCGSCLQVCPFGALSLDNENIAVVSEACTGCGPVYRSVRLRL